MKIEDKDIATIEALHDMLLDKHKVPLDHPTMKKSRELTAKMYLDMGYVKKKKDDGSIEYLSTRLTEMNCVYHHACGLDPCVPYECEHFKFKMKDEDEPEDGIIPPEWIEQHNSDPSKW